MKKLLFILVLLFSVARAEAAIRYASPTGSGSACTVISTPCTLATAASQVVAGDTLHLLNGTYVQATLSNIVPSGVSNSQHTIIEGQSEAGAIIQPTAFSKGFSFSVSRDFITMRKFTIDMANAERGNQGIVTVNGTAGFFVLEDLTVKNVLGQAAITCGGPSDGSLGKGDWIVRRIKVHDVTDPGQTVDTNGGAGIYYQCPRGLVEYSEFWNVTGADSTILIQANGIDQPGNIVRYNVCRDSGSVVEGSGNRCISVQEPGTEVYGNFVYNNIGAGIRIGTGAANSKIRGNTLWNNGSGIFNQTSSGVLIANNITLIGGITAGSATLQTNLTSGTPSAIFINTATGNLCLQSGAATAIDQGTAQAGFAFNGSAPDIGACESISTAAITAVATDSNVDILLPSNIAAFLPLQPASAITGFTLSDGRTVTSASRLSDSIIRLTYTGSCTGGTLAYTPGNVTDNARIGNLVNQPLFAFTGKAITNDCGGGIPPPPPGLHVHYLLDEGTGTNANDETANGLDGTLTLSPTWITGHLGGGVYFPPSIGSYIAVPYGDTVNPSTQSLTIAKAVLPDANAIANTFTTLGVPLGTNQRFQISAFDGTWSLGMQASAPAANTEFPVAAAWTRLCVVVDSGTDTATLHVNGVAGTSAQSIKAYTSFAFSGNLDIGRRSGVTNEYGFAVDDFKLWTSAESCADDYAAWNPPPSGGTGSFTQVAYQFYLARKDAAGNLLKLPSPAAAINASISIPAGGVVDMEIQANCDNVANCDPIGMVLQRAPLLTDTWADVPDADIGAASFYGTSDGDSAIPSGVPTCPLSGALACIDGGTARTASAIPIIDLGQNESTVNRYLVKINESSRFRLRNQDGNVFGTYSQYPTVNVVGNYAGAGF